MKTVAGKNRDPYRKRARRLEPVLIKAGIPSRFVVLYAREGYRDWNGSAYQEQTAEFIGEQDGWRYGDTVYPSLLLAVRQAIRDGR